MKKSQKKDLGMGAHEGSGASGHTEKKDLSMGARERSGASDHAKSFEPNQERIAGLVRQLLVELGEDPERDGLKKTPERVAKAMAYLTRGYRQTPRGVLNNAIFDSGTNHMIVLRNIEVYSLCEHHMLPFYGSCAIGYIAKNKVLGVSKLARIVDCFARRLQIQERLTEQVAQAIQEAAKAEGVGVVFKCKHLCMMMRGVEKQNSEMVTSAMLGSFRSDEKVRQEFLSLIK